MIVEYQVGSFLHEAIIIKHFIPETVSKPKSKKVKK